MLYHMLPRHVQRSWPIVSVTKAPRIKVCTFSYGACQPWAIASLWWGCIRLWSWLTMFCTIFLKAPPTFTCSVLSSIQIAKYPDWSWMWLPSFCQADIINLGIPRYHFLMHEPEQQTQNLDLHLNIGFPCLRRALHCREEWCQFRFAGEDQLLCKQDRCVTVSQWRISCEKITMYHTGLLQEDLPETIHHFILHFVFVLVKSMLLFSPLTLGSGICIHLDYKIVVVKHEHIFEGAATTASNIVLDRDVFLSLRPIPENQNNGSTFNLLLAFSFLNFDPIRPLTSWKSLYVYT